MDDAANIKVLTIDDDDLLRNSIVAFLEDYSYTPLSADNGRSGLEVFREESPDIILLDLRMPEMDGIELLPILVKEAPETPVIIVSGMGTLDDSIQALRLGAWDYITKPIHDFALLEHTMHRALDRAHLIQENRRYKEHLEEEVARRTQQLERLNRALHTLSAGNEALVRANNEPQLLEQLCSTIQTVGGYDAVWVGYLEDNIFYSKANKGLPENYHDNYKLEDSAVCAPPPCPLSDVGKGTPVIINDINEKNVCSKYRSTLEPLGIHSMLGYPLKTDDKVFGAIVIYSKETGTFGAEEARLLCELGGDLNFGIQALRLRVEHEQITQERVESAQRLEDAMVQSIGAIAMTLEKRDPYTAGHQQRVAQIAVAIAQEMKLDSHLIEGLKLGALIHDIGKVYVPAEILNRPGRLSPEEFELIKSHPQVGYDIMKDVTFPWPVASMILQHHERLDGGGYPNGLTEGDIILEARILAVADVIEAMSSHRPYRPALGIEIALEEIEKNSGKIYDADICEAALTLFRDKGFVINQWQSAG